MNSSDNPALGIGLRLRSGLLMVEMFVSVNSVRTTVLLGQIVLFRSFSRFCH